jgi:hypothetical protein
MVRRKYICFVFNQIGKYIAAVSNITMALGHSSRFMAQICARVVVLTMI